MNHSTPPSGSALSAAELSVVIPALNDRGHLADIIRALEDQLLPVREVIISHSGSGCPGITSAGEVLAIHYLHSDQPLTSGAARNRGAKQATGKWLAFLDDDVMPRRDWSTRVAATLAQDAGNGCFVGSIDTDTPGGYWGMTLWFLEFGSVHKYLPTRSLEGGASANMFMHRAVHSRAGGFPEDVARCVDVEFMASCRRAGGSTNFIPAAIVGHRNIPGRQYCLRHAQSLGAGSARVRKQARIRGDIFARYPVAVPLLVPARTLLMSYRVARWGRGYRLAFLVHFPGVVLALLAWARGFYMIASNDLSSVGTTA